MDDATLRDISEAAAYVGMTERAFRNHVDTIKDVQPEPERGKHGKRLFSVSTLQHFMSIRRPQGRPKGRRNGRSTQTPAPTADE